MVSRAPNTFPVPWQQIYDLKEKTQTHSCNKYMRRPGEGPKLSPWGEHRKETVLHTQRRHSPRGDGPSLLSKASLLQNSKPIVILTALMSSIY